jgi:hypothetical protein
MARLKDVIRMNTKQAQYRVTKNEPIAECYVKLSRFKITMTQWQNRRVSWLWAGGKCVELFKHTNNNMATLRNIMITQVTEE